MKKLILLFAIILVAFQAKAQDKLITQSGDVKIVYNVEVGPTNIFYKLENKDGASLQQILKKDVVMIIHQNGSKELFGVGDSALSKLETSQKMSTISSSEINSHPKTIESNDFIPVTYTDEKSKGGGCRMYYVVYQPKKGSIIEDDNISVEYKVIGYDDGSSSLGLHYVLKPVEDMTKPHLTYGLDIKLKNKTNKTIYIDLGNTFITRETEAMAYYVPTATSSTNGTNGGIGVNLGSVAGALGVGGVAGGIANGIGVEGGASSSSTTTTYSQRIIAIPPFSQKTLKDQYLFPIGSGPLYNGNIHNITEDKKTAAVVTLFPCFKQIKKGESTLFNENDSPLAFSFYTTYSFNENCSETSNLHVNIYVNQVIGIPTSSKPNLEYLSSDWKEKPYFIVMR